MFSRIGILHEDGTTETIFCYWGHPKHIMPLLTEYYDTISKIKALLALGDISYLKKRVAPDQDDPVNSVDHPDDVTVAYYRDCSYDPNWGIGHETMSPAVIHKSIDFLIGSCTYIEYVYLFDEKTGRWMQPIVTGYTRKLKH